MSNATTQKIKVSELFCCFCSVPTWELTSNDIIAGNGRILCVHNYELDQKILVGGYYREWSNDGKLNSEEQLTSLKILTSQMEKADGKNKLADMLLLLKCFEIKMVKLLGCSSVGASLCSWPTKKKLPSLKIW